MALRKITQADLDSLRMPPDAAGNPGSQDLEALKAVSWGTPYDYDARRQAIEDARNRITAALIAQQVPAPVAQQIAAQQVASLGGTDAGTSQGVSGSQAGDAGTSSTGSSATTGGSNFGGSAAPGSDFMSGAPPGASMFGTGDRQTDQDQDQDQDQTSDRTFDPGAMTTAMASMVGDPLGEQGAISVSPFGREGDDTSEQSQATQAADKAALAEAAMGRGPIANTFADRFSEFGSPPGARDFAQTTPEEAGVNTPGWGAPNDYNPTTPEEAGVNTPGWGAPNQPADVVVAAPNEPDQQGGRTAFGPSDNAPAAPSGFGSFGGFTGFGATGGYEGSASMSNTQGSVAMAAFSAGFDAGAASVSGEAGADPGGGDPGGGSSSDGSSSSGDTTGGSSGVG